MSWTIGRLILEAKYIFKTGLNLALLFTLVYPAITQAGMFDTLRTIKQAGDAKDAYESVKAIRAAKGMENAEPIYSKMKRIYIKADLKPAKGNPVKMNELVEEVLCDNVDRIVDNLEKYDMEGATPKCKTGMPKKTGKKNVVILSVNQESGGSGIHILAQNVEEISGRNLKTVRVDGVSNYREAIEKLVDEIHGDLVISSRTNNPISLGKWPKRFKKYSKKKKHREVSIKRKQRKQLEANMAE